MSGQFLKLGAAKFCGGGMNRNSREASYLRTYYDRVVIFKNISKIYLRFARNLAYVSSNCPSDMNEVFLGFLQGFDEFRGRVSGP